jgi:hypothetical protein
MPMPPTRGTRIVKHPEELGFNLGLIIRIGEPAHIIQQMPDASRARGVVYVALLAEMSRPFEKGHALKIGQTKGSLMARWLSIGGIFRRDNIRPNEKEDRRKWLDIANRKQVSVWMKEAGKIDIPYARGLTSDSFSSRLAEEEFLDQYYEPKLGMRLNRRVV